ncbi:MAG: DUF3488 and transglutaminase-like domain-containing protein [Anaerolineae bacterium]|nr:DUF3488 and transglutaminase-like domain-containing protein [Anaerolineae bacterium]
MIDAREADNPRYVRLIIWAGIRFRPNVGWLPFALILSCVFVFVYAFTSAEWVPETSVVTVNAMLGLLLATVLAHQTVQTVHAWLLIAVYGIVLTLIQTASLLPGGAALRGGWSAVQLDMLQSLALWLDRLNGWTRAVVGGDESSETLPFIIAMALLAWFLAAFAGWQIFRKRDPLTAVGLMGLAVAINAFFAGDAYLTWVAIYLLLALILVGFMRYFENEWRWQRNRLDYSTEIKTELFLILTGITVALVVVAVALPSLRSQTLSTWFSDLPPVQTAEDTLSRAFLAIESRRRGLGSDGFRDGPGGSGILPREFLIGEAPELYDTVAMTATVAGDVSLPHWRSVSMDTYTGRGWARSEERAETISAETPLALPDFQSQTTISQTVTWLLDKRASRYTLGLPTQFDQDVVAQWRGVDDLARVQSVDGQSYAATSITSNATVNQLRSVNVRRIPLTVAARYTALPNDIPERVTDLAFDIVADLTNPYDQAVAIEQFLRQYPYDLNVPPPDPSVDIVDYFLFDAQAGYCDYYASAMVVLARSIGLPARLGIGFLAQPPDENGVQTIRQINGHSWAEVYFADYGWIEFEPTAAFASFERASSNVADNVESNAPLQREPERPEPAPIPQRAPQRSTTFWWILPLLLGILLLGGVLLWLRRRNRVPFSDIAVAFAQLQRRASRIGVPVVESATPFEFRQSLLRRLAELREHRWVQRSTYLQERIDSAETGIDPLVNGYVVAQYSRHAAPMDVLQSASATHLNSTLWLLRWLP